MPYIRISIAGIGNQLAVARQSLGEMQGEEK